MGPFRKWMFIIPVLPKIDDSANVGNKSLRREEQNKFRKKVTFSVNWTWDPRIPLVTHLVLHSHAFLTELAGLTSNVKLAQWGKHENVTQDVSQEESPLEVTYLLRLFCSSLTLYCRLCQNHMFWTRVWGTVSSKGVATKIFLLGVGYQKNFIRWGWGTNKCSYGAVGYFQWGLLLPNIFRNSKFREVWWHHSCPVFCLQSCRANQNSWMTLVSLRIHLWKSRTHLEKNKIVFTL